MDRIKKFSTPASATALCVTLTACGGKDGKETELSPVSNIELNRTLVVVLAEPAPTVEWKVTQGKIITAHPLTLRMLPPKPMAQNIYLKDSIFNRLFLYFQDYFSDNGEKISAEWFADGVYYRETVFVGSTYLHNYDFAHKAVDFAAAG